MKTLPVAYAILVACTLVARADLQLHWPLDEASGTVVADASGNGLDGGWQGSAGSVGWLPDGGVDGGAVEFSGADRDSFITSNFSAVDGTPFTLSAWVKTESSAKDGLVYLGDGSTGSSYYLMQIQGGNAKTVARNTSETAATGPDINDGEWHHVVCVFAGTTARRVYTDGVLRNTSDTNVPEVSLNRFGIGALTRNSPHTPVDLYTGQLDDVALWDRAFSISDIAALRGLALHGAGNAGDLEAFAAAFASQQPVLVRGQNWDYATGLTGGIGATAGSIGGGDASIVLDGSGNGMRLAGSTEPSVVSFGADHPAVAPGVPVTLSWQTFNASTASIGGIGSVDPSAGSITVTPAATTTYTLTVSGDDGSAQAEVTVAVSSSPVDPQISEFLAKNETGLRDDDGARSDWIEMHNPSGFALDLSGYKLTNDAGVLPMWSFPPLVLASGEYLVVFASAKDSTDPGAPLHTNFSLDADGSYLALVRPDGSTVVQEFAPAFPAQRDDLSYSAAGFHSPPTPGEENSAGAQAGILQKKVTFGTPGGLFFGGTVNLSLSHVDVAATIRYTLDGSVPDASSAAYTAPIPITSTTLVKAAVFRPDYIPGPLSQEGYIFADPELSGFDSNLPILVIDTFDTAVPRGDRAFK
ncbi:MAG: LamG-like jellyroll fold domain-containing protein, partial [Verrucomicrobiales bacterium]